MRAKTHYDLNTLVIIANFCVCAIAVILYYSKGGNQYVNAYTVVLLCIFGVQNLLMLSYEKKKRDPFVLILIIMALVFYMGRVVTLLYDPWSLTLARHSSTPDDLNYSLMFVVFSNASIFLGLSIIKGKITYKKKIPDEYPANPRSVMTILLFAIVMGSYISLAANTIGRIAGYIVSTFVNLQLVLLFTSVYLVISLKENSRWDRIGFLILIVTFGVLTTLRGSRSAVLTLACLMLVAWLSAKGRITFSRKSILLGIILLAISVFLFNSATYIRQVVPSTLVVSTEQLNILKEAALTVSKDISLLGRRIFDRIGFLDYSAVMIRNQKRYGKIVNFRYYFKSIIDNVLTPGFDIFGTPRVAHSMSYIARGESVPTYESIARAYQSNILTVYGEYSVLFHGYPALIILFALSCLFKKLYLSIGSRDAFLFYLYRALILYAFYLWLNSFGIDWMLFDLMGIIITVGLFKNFYKMRTRRVKTCSWR
jgi:hypothetical protein